MSRPDIALLWTALLLGVIANAAMAGLYAVGPPLYPTAVRTTGMGWAIGIGRFGAILAPLASGALLDRGWLPAQLYFFSEFFVTCGGRPPSHRSGSARPQLPRWNGSPSGSRGSRPQTIRIGFIGRGVSFAQ